MGLGRTRLQEIKTLLAAEPRRDAAFQVKNGHHRSGKTYYGFNDLKKINIIGVWIMGL